MQSDKTTSEVRCNRDLAPLVIKEESILLSKRGSGFINRPRKIDVLSDIPGIIAVAFLPVGLVGNQCCFLRKYNCRLQNYGGDPCPAVKIYDETMSESGNKWEILFLL